MKTAVEILKEARELLAEPGKWTQLTSARDEYGNEVGSSSGAAVCWCASGAITKVAAGSEAADEARTLLWSAMGGSIVGFNDAQSDVAPVLVAFSRAVAKAEGGTL
jgi:hypothetical protein